MIYLISGLVGFVLTLLVSLPFQNIVTQRETKAFGNALKNKIEEKMGKGAEVDVKVQPIVVLDDKKNEPRIKFLPQYPADAAAQKIEGYVTLSFRVSKDGSVQNLKVTESSPPQIFDEAALAAVKKWSFANSSKPVDHHRLRLNFSLGRTVAVDQRVSDSGI